MMRLPFLIPTALLVYTLSCGTPTSEDVGNKVGMTAPSLELSTIDNRSINSHDFKGSYLLIDFWGSWCGPCHRELPELVTLYNEMSGIEPPLKVLSIALEKKASNGIKFSKQMDFPWEYQVVNESRYVRFDDAANAFGVTDIPSSFLIDPDGRILASHSSISAIRELLLGLGS